MTERKPLSISVDVDTNKMQLKLRAIAKHAEALADELDAIDNAWQCEECGSSEYSDYGAHGDMFARECDSCGEEIVMRLPEQTEG